MIARYNECDYLYVANRRRKEIVTTKSQKADASFVYEGNLYFKEVLEEDLSDIYSVEFWVSYKTNILHTPEQWKLSNEKSVITDAGVLLTFAEGILPGWDIVERNVCSHKVNISEISAVRIVLRYKKKDGKVCNGQVIEEKSIAVSELDEYLNRYNKFNL